MAAAKDKGAKAARLAAESAEKFSKAAERERGSRGAPPGEHLRVLEETIEEERQAVEEFGEAVELQRQAVEERAAELAARHPPGPEAEGEVGPKRAAKGDGKK